MNHTPGPWILEIGEDRCFHKGNRVAITKEYPPTKENGCEPQNVTIAEVWPASNSLDRADGALLAAAPDLLAALQLLTIEASGYEMGVRQYLNNHGQAAPAGLPLALEQARAAIAKATDKETA